MKTDEIRIRDPFVVSENGFYYMTGTDFTPASICAYKSADFVNWEKLERPLYHCGSDSTSIDVTDDFWAPELHRYAGRFYLFFSPLYKSGRRGTQLAVSDSIEGPYRLIQDGPSTPEAQSCIDGTLYVEDGVPYIVYSHDWPDCYRPEKDFYDGEICAARLSDDLCTIIGEPFVLFKGSDPKFAVPNEIRMWDKPDPVLRYGTDGPFLHRTSEGELILLWSPMIDQNYVVAMAKSDNGKLLGHWSHAEAFLYENNGGHAMLLEQGGELLCCIHAPEKWFSERPFRFSVKERDGWLTGISGISTS